MTRRPRIDTGALGIITLVLPDAAATRRFLAALATNRPDRYEGLQAWSGGEFVIESGAAVAVGLDGEAMDMEPPLRFSIRPHALRVRLAPNAIGFSPAARTSSARDVLPNLWNVALAAPSPSVAEAAASRG
jgi:diacylglycerol kinase family enzyme